MSRQKTLEEMYDLCVSRGQLIELAEIDKERSKALYSTASILLDSVKAFGKQYPLASFSLHYSALSMYARSLLLLSKLETFEDQCLFAALCLKNLDFDWNFMEKIRALRHSAFHNGKQISHSEWKEVELGFTLTLSLLKKEIEKAL